MKLLSQREAAILHSASKAITVDRHRSPKTKIPSSPHLFLISLSLFLLSSCETDPYVHTTYPDGMPDMGSDLSPLDGQTDAVACVPKTEICDGKDNDCNGKVDDVAASSLATNAKHCGKCDNACSFPYAFASCVAGACKLGSCAPGYHDLNKKDLDGCEYQCVPSNKKVEICDNLDNDCDGTIDNGVNKATDVKNCGACGNACAFLNASGSCTGGKCVINACNNGYKNVDGIGGNGCEYKCPVWPPLTTDGCDGKDSDCDGTADEDFVSSACGSSVGECAQGTTTCLAGSKSCKGDTGPSVEVCNNKDDDCDGKVDDGFDKQSDPRYCGGCSPCILNNAVANCKSGLCGIAVCKTGYVDLDKKAGNGCEYGCIITGIEICDGLDNDCNGLVDDAVSLAVKLCKDKGPCKGAKTLCKGKDGWQCSYGKDVELQPCKKDADCGAGYSCKGGICPGVVITDEKLCDGIDGDCDGKADDPWSAPASTAKALGAACDPDPTKIGACKPKGIYACNAAQTGVQCTQILAGASPQNELCNGLDDDCDGKVDEQTDDGGYKGVVDAMVHVQRSAGGKYYDFYIYSHEAARPDSSGSGAGKATTRACSKASVLPWSKATYAQAAAACAAAGKRLCSGAEWEVACQGSGGKLYPYGASYQAKTCNGVDRPAGKPVATGSLGSCVGGQAGLYDMSGNLREWTSGKAGSTGGSPPRAIYVVRGGAYNTPGPGLSCTFSLSKAVEDVVLPSVGFRCCSDKAP